MSERKVLNKYYPPDFDPNDIPRLKQERNRQWNIRIMAPFNMRCNTCGEYIYKGKKFNSRKEDVEDEDYLGLKIFRFYIRCPRCVAEIAFKTDPASTDYALEAGATRNFEAAKTAELLARREIEEKEAEEKNNPMKVLENRTKASRQEMDMLETLEDLKQLNSRHAKLDHEQVIKKHEIYEQKLKELQDEEDENFVQSIFGKNQQKVMKRLHDDDEAEEIVPPIKKEKQKPTDILSAQPSLASSSKSSVEKPAWSKSIGSIAASKNKLSGLIVKKKPEAAVKVEVTPKLSNPPAANTGLSLVGAYSDSDQSD
ncbi:hypothetical protein CAPTEDRAFT_160604 [Capitella teleta]|uniref:Splicing factor YJU2 n=1 Tax=Capitella teleta TaxID=283909 RepID=R7TTU7_CAPTE|nr:hypothetical protein CAPTEDRAFT_160604 [Capitella teleta]|eukprot:ELT97109.1 hypothetical protein CAPTEDRAFT_160604 [Capitella teleta]